MADGTEIDAGPSERVIVADGTLSNGSNEKERTKNTYIGVDGGWAGHRAPHLAGKIPAGGNLLMLDGHSEWRKFDKMVVRTDGSNPSFWW
jgi:prepilin-type processing-associated H-X9-DG protein